MKIEIDIKTWPIKKEIEKLLIEAVKEELQNTLKNKDSWFMKEVARECARLVEISVFYGEDGNNFRKLILAEFIKSMKYDEKKQMLTEALIKNR